MDDANWEHNNLVAARRNYAQALENDRLAGELAKSARRQAVLALINVIFSLINFAIAFANIVQGRHH